QRATSERPFRAVLVGEPNAGKSSLFNALGGTALVSPQPGTTRDYLVTRIEVDRVLVEVVDTAGWQDGADSIGLQAQSFRRSQSEDADLVLLCVEAGNPSLSPLPGRPGEEGRGEGPPVLLLATKCDLAVSPAGRLPTSAFTGLGLAQLRSRLA